jgi:hypothetical protein
MRWSIVLAGVMASWSLGICAGYLLAQMYLRVTYSANPRKLHHDTVMVFTGSCVAIGMTGTVLVLVKSRRETPESLRARGRCQVCAYPIGDSPRCSECGADVREEQRS